MRYETISSGLMYMEFESTKDRRDERTERLFGEIMVKNVLN